MKKNNSVENFNKLLISEGWRTPHSYSASYKQIPASPGIYMLLVYDMSFKKSKNFICSVAYIGKSTNLSNRLSGHEVISLINDQINEPMMWVFPWFKEFSIDEIHAQEILYIKKYDPPFNLIHRLKVL